MVDLQPTKCNICNGKVIFTSNRIIYGKEYGSGKCYYCMDCGSYVGTHKPRPQEAFGILADKEMRAMKRICHELFDRQWENEPTIRERSTARKKAYRMLAEKLSIPVEECHFGYFDLAMLKRAYEVLQE